MPNHNILIVEPNTELTIPYLHIPSSLKLIRVPSVELGLNTLSKTIPKAVFLSASISITKNVAFLEALKNASNNALIPLCIVIDLSHRLSLVPGTTWGGKLGVLTSIISKKEFDSTFMRIQTPR